MSPDSTVTNEPARRILTVEEVAEELGISRSLAYEAVRQGKIPSIRIGRRILVPRNALQLMLEDAGRLTPGRLDNDIEDARDAA